MKWSWLPASAWLEGCGSRNDLYDHAFFISPWKWFAASFRDHGSHIFTLHDMGFRGAGGWRRQDVELVEQKGRTMCVDLFSNYRCVLPARYDLRLFLALPTCPYPGGIKACSRWFREERATPPDNVSKCECTPAGVPATSFNTSIQIPFIKLHVRFFQNLGQLLSK